MTLVPDCTQETVNFGSTTASDILYTFNDAAGTYVLTTWLASSSPTLCPIDYQLSYSTDSGATYQASLTPIQPFLTWTNTSQTIQVVYTTDNQYSPLDTDNVYLVRLTGTLWGGQAKYIDFNVKLTKFCGVATIVQGGGDVTTEFIRNTVITADENKIELIPFTTNDQYCVKQYEVTEWNDDGDLSVDTSSEPHPEFQSVLPTTAGSNLFYKADNLVTSFYINVAKPLLNTDSNWYFFRVRYHFDGQNSNEDYAFVNVTLLADCRKTNGIDSGVSINVPSQETSKSYTFNSAAQTHTLSSFTSTHPSNCSVEYTLTVEDMRTSPTSSGYQPVTSFPFLQWDNTTLTLVIDYHTDNEWSPEPGTGVNLYRLKLTGCLWGYSTGECENMTPEYFEVDMIKDCGQANIVPESSAAVNFEFIRNTESVVFETQTDTDFYDYY